MIITDVRNKQSITSTCFNNSVMDNFVRIMPEPVLVVEMTWSLFAWKDIYSPLYKTCCHNMTFLSNLHITFSMHLLHLKCYRNILSNLVCNIFWSSFWYILVVTVVVSFGSGYMAVSFWCWQLYGFHGIVQKVLAVLFSKCCALQWFQQNGLLFGSKWIRLIFIQKLL